MEELSFFENYTQLIKGIETCLSKNLAIPALILIYSTVDSVSWLASDIEDQPVGEAFQAWVGNWMLGSSTLSCTAEELYAARCGLLHTLTPNSRLTDTKGVRRISYAWGTAKQEDLEESIKLLQYPGLVAVHVNDLFQSFRDGFANYLEMLDNNSLRKEAFIRKARKHFMITNESVVSDFLAVAKEAGVNTGSNGQQVRRSHRHKHA